MAIISSKCVCLVTQLCLTPCDRMDHSPPGSSLHGDSPDKRTGMGCHALLQDVPNPGIKPRSLTWQADSLPTEPPGKPVVSRANTILIRCDSFAWRITAIRVILSRFPKLRLKLKGISSEQQVCGSYQEPMAHL